MYTCRAIILDDEESFNECLTLRRHETEIDDEGNTPVLFALKYNKILYALSLISNSSLDVLNKGDLQGLTPLHIAVKSNNKVMINTLLDLGVDLDCKDINLMTPLFDAVKNNNIELVRVLINEGACISTASIADITPLRLAYDLGFKEIVNLLAKELRRG
jgi:ankyrin repeat protein